MRFCKGQQRALSQVVFICFVLAWMGTEENLTWSKRHRALYWIEPSHRFHASRSNKAVEPNAECVCSEIPVQDFGIHSQNHVLQ